MTGLAENAKKIKNFDGRIEAIMLMPHNLVFGSTPEMTVLGGSRILWRGPGVTCRAENEKKMMGPSRRLR